MRVIAGRFGGQQFSSPHGNRTHPMSDKIRGALFNALGDIEGLTVLDAYAGSGALGIEAVSRGARSVVAIDSDKNAQRAIHENSRALGMNKQLKLIAASAHAWLSTTSDMFDIVLLDPPYDAVNTQTLSELANRVRVSGMVVLSLPPGTLINLGDKYSLLREKDFNDAKLYFYRRQAES